MKQILNNISLYEKASGAKVNNAKTEAMLLGKWKRKRWKLFGLRWVENMKILGVYFGSGNLDILNWQPKLEKLTKVLNLRRTHELS